MKGLKIRLASIKEVKIQQVTKAKMFAVLDRFKNPVVITSIVSQIYILVTVFKGGVSTGAINSLFVAICSILVSLGVLNNPTNVKSIKKVKIKCSNCGEAKEYLFSNGNLMCDEEGNPFVISEEEIKKKSKRKFLK